jgi:hypothetical protein
MTESLRGQLNRVQRAGLVVGLAGLALCGVGAAFNARQFFISYLFGYTFWLGLSLGCLGVAMIHYLAGGRWGFVTRRFLEAGFMNLPLMALLFVPLLFGLRELYPWARPGDVAASTVLQHKQIYLNLPAFVGRAAFFFLVWIVMAFLLRKWSLQQDTSADPQATVRMRTLSGPGIVIYPVTATFAFVDWIMSIEPAWYSTMFMVIVLIGQVLTAFALVTMLLTRVQFQEPFAEVVTHRHFHDLGNLLLAFVVFWTYVSFGQLLIIYSGNLPREIDWYLHRIAGNWKWWVVILGLFHFFVPFFLLLFRDVKRNASRLAAVAALIFAVHLAAVFWLVAPTFFPQDIHLHWLDVAAPLGLGGLWVAGFAASVKKCALLPANDPRIDYAIISAAHAG